VVLGGGAVTFWVVGLSPGSKVPVWPAWTLSAFTIGALYLCFAWLFRMWPSRGAHSDGAGSVPVAGGTASAGQRVTGSPGGIQAGAGARVKTRDTIAPLRVMVVDDHEFVRESISRLLREQGIIVVAEEASVRAAINAADRFQPDVVVMDISLPPDGSGIEATREIRDRNPRIRVLMLTASDDEEALISSIMAGADGYVRKRVSSDELIAAVRAVGEGRNLVDADMIGALMERIRADQNAVADLHSPASVDGAASSERQARLSAQENRVLSLIAKGLTNRRITAETGLSEKAVRNYVSSILGKLGISHRSDPGPDRGGTGHDV